MLVESRSVDTLINTILAHLFARIWIKPRSFVRVCISPFHCKNILSTHAFPSKSLSLVDEDPYAVGAPKKPAACFTFRSHNLIS